MGADTRRARIENLIELARLSKGWSQSQLADFMGRSPGRLCPASGNPKSDFIMKLAEVLGWTPGEVLEVIWEQEGSGGPKTNGVSYSFDQLFDQALEAVEAGRHQELLRIARLARESARTPDQIACAYNFEVGAWDGLGRYLNALEAAQKGLEIPNLDARWRCRLQANLANALYTLWRLPGALGLADLLVRRHGRPEAEADEEAREFAAFLHYLRGNTLRRLMRVEMDDRLAHATQAREDLAWAMSTYEDLAAMKGSSRYAGIARTCEAALLEVRSELGDLSAEDAVTELAESLDAVIDPSEVACGDLLESYGWSCVFGSNIALSSLRGPELQRSVDLFVQKALEIADVLDNWALRERAITLQYELHRMLVEPTGLRFDFVVEEETRNLVAQTMGRFPGFRPVGWRILNSASVARKSQEARR